MIPGIYGFEAVKSEDGLIDVIGRLGLSTNLKLCLDAGDANSYTTGQVWTDLSGTGTNVSRGGTTSAAGDDPTFNGTAGVKSAGEYFSFDGGDYFEVVTQPGWVSAMHQDNAKYTLLYWIRPVVTNATHPWFTTVTASVGEPGIDFRCRSSGVLNIFVSNVDPDIGDQPLNRDGPAYAANAWQMMFVSVDEAAGGTASFIGINTTVTAFNGTYNVPSAGAALHDLRIGANHTSSIAPNGTRIGMCAAWQGTALTQAQVSSIFGATRHRYGV